VPACRLVARDSMMQDAGCRGPGGGRGQTGGRALHCTGSGGGRRQGRGPGGGQAAASSLGPGRARAAGQGRAGPGAGGLVVRGTGGTHLSLGTGLDATTAAGAGRGWAGVWQGRAGGSVGGQEAAGSTPTFSGWRAPSFMLPAEEPQGRWWVHCPAGSAVAWADRRSGSEQKLARRWPGGRVAGWRPLGAAAEGGPKLRTAHCTVHCSLYCTVAKGLVARAGEGKGGTIHLSITGNRGEGLHLST